MFLSLTETCAFRQRRETSKRYWMIRWTTPRGQPILELGVLFAFELDAMQQPDVSSQELTVAAPRANCATAWLDLMRTTDKLLLAGLRQQIGPDGDLQQEYRRWYADHMREHDDALRQLVRRLHPNPGAS
jgi:hypothetical protein